MTAQSKIRVPTKAAIKRIVDAAKEAGIKVGGLEVTPDGTIRVLNEKLAATAPSGNDYDDWKRQEG